MEQGKFFLKTILKIVLNPILKMLVCACFNLLDEDAEDDDFVDVV